MQQKISENRQDSFWYHGEIARKGKWYICAEGDIAIRFEDGRIEHNDRAVSKVIDDNRYLIDDDLQRFEFLNNNWFSLYHDEEDILDCIYDTYDEAIEVLKDVDDSIYMNPWEEDQ